MIRSRDHHQNTIHLQSQYRLLEEGRREEEKKKKKMRKLDLKGGLKEEKWRRKGEKEEKRGRKGGEKEEYLIEQDHSKWGHHNQSAIKKREKKEEFFKIQTKLFFSFLFLSLNFYLLTRPITRFTIKFRTTNTKIGAKKRLTICKQRLVKILKKKLNKNNKKNHI